MSKFAPFCSTERQQDESKTKAEHVLAFGETLTPFVSRPKTKGVCVLKRKLLVFRFFSPLDCVYLEQSFAFVSLCLRHGGGFPTGFLCNNWLPRTGFTVKFDRYLTFGSSGLNPGRREVQQQTRLAPPARPSYEPLSEKARPFAFC